MTPTQRIIVADYQAGLPTRLIADARSLYDALRVAGVRPNRHATSDEQRRAANAKRSRSLRIARCRAELARLRLALANLETRIAAARSCQP